MKLKLLIPIFCIFLLLAIPIYAEEEESVDLGWYEIDEWELAVCGSFWGGVRQIAEGSEEPARLGIDYYTNDIIVTLNAERSDPLPYNSTTYGYIYEVSWYVQPLFAGVNFEVRVTSSSGGEETIDSSSANSVSGFSGYYAINMPADQELESATLEVFDMDLTLTVPFVDPDKEPPTKEDFYWLGLLENDEE